MAKVSDPPTAESGKDLKDFVGLYHSPSHSFYRKRLAAMGGTSDQPTFQKLKIFVSSQLAGWVGEYLKARFAGKYGPFPSYPAGQNVFYSEQNGMYKLADESIFSGQADEDRPVRVSIAGDWGTGTDEAERVAQGMLAFDPHFTIHLGDIYYVGDQPEIDENCLDTPNPDNDYEPVRWPWGSVGSFALNGNHEMYAGGKPYFTSFLPTLGVRPAAGATALSKQNASFFCVENKYWRIIAVDTGYNSIGVPILENIPLVNNIPGVGGDCKLDDKITAWLQQQVNPNGDNRGIILLSHHQYYSSFDDWYTKSSSQMAPFLNRQVIWLWGHEHRMAVYGGFQVGGGVQAHGRCIGHGGMPVAHSTPDDNKGCPWRVYDNRPYTAAMGNDEGIDVGVNGYVNLTFSQDTLRIAYHDLTSPQNPLMTEDWRVDLASGGLQGPAFDILCQDPEFHYR